MDAPTSGCARFCVALTARNKALSSRNFAGCPFSTAHCCQVGMLSKPRSLSRGSRSQKIRRPSRGSNISPVTTSFSAKWISPALPCPTRQTEELSRSICSYSVNIKSIEFIVKFMASNAVGMKSDFKSGAKSQKSPLNRLLGLCIATGRRGGFNLLGSVLSQLCSGRLHLSGKCSLVVAVSLNTATMEQVESLPDVG